MKLWSGRFSKETHQLVEEFNASIPFDYQLAPYDIEGSLAHVSMLGKCGVLSEQDVISISEGLKKIAEKIKKGQVDFRVSDEDVHMNIERLLYEEIGEVAGKLHTGRSRNDQVALDLHLYLRDQILAITAQTYELLTVILRIASVHVDTIMPGYTHLQRAEPVRFAHHMLAYFNMFYRDLNRLQDSLDRVNQSPLGAGALAGSGVSVDPDYVAKLLQFEAAYTNSLDAVSDRDFVIEFLSNASLMMMHFSRLSEEIILWNSHEFSFVQMDDAFSTGSSMMPQKKNPDVCELVRGKTGRVYGALIGLLTVLKGLPLAYNKDMQEDKEGLFDTVKTVRQTLAVYTGLLNSMQVNAQQMRKATEADFSNATNLANYLSQYIPFREAHAITGKIVRYCLDNECLLRDLDLKTYRSFCNVIDEKVFSCLSIESVVEAHQSKGGTSKKSVENQLKTCQKSLEKLAVWLEKKSC